MKVDKNALLMGAISGLMMVSSCSAATTKTVEVTDPVMCYGVNACKGNGACAGKVDACSGKNGCSAEVKCAGHNSCKGKGLVKLSKKECLDKGGKVAGK